MSTTIDQVHIDQVLTALQQQATRCPMEEVSRLCPDLTDDQVFLAIDYLTRSGQVCLTRDINRTYWVQASRSVAGEYSLTSPVASQILKREPSIS
jgi:hypothetical protein